MTRQKLIILFISVFVLGIAGVFLGFMSVAWKADSDHNVIIVSLTDIRADHLGVYGYYRDTSSNIDQFAKESILFEQAFLQGSRSAMNFASLFTSQYPRANGVVFVDKVLSPFKVTLPEVLQDQGYETGAFVQSSQLLERYGIMQGFSNLSHVTDVISSAAEWITQNKDERLFLFLEWYDETSFHSPPPFEHYFDPGYSGVLSNHDQFYLSLNPREHSNAVLQKLKTINGQAVIEQEQGNLPLKNRDLEHLIAHYDDGIRYADAFFGQVLDMLKETGIYEDSIIVLLADHGESLDDHLERDQMNNIQLTGHAQVYDEIIHTPLIIKYPELNPERISIQVQLIDLFPTILDFLGILPTREVKEQMQGESLLPLMEGKAKEDFNEYVYGQTEAIQDIMFVRSKRWKLMLWTNKQFVLYDLQNDPGETSNVIEQHPEVAEQLKQKLSEWHLKNIKVKLEGEI